MGWSKWPYWLKGAQIGVFVGIGVPFTATSLMIVRAVVELISKPSSGKNISMSGTIGWKLIPADTTTRSAKLILSVGGQAASFTAVPSSY